jgi:hypothetical protein
VLKKPKKLSVHLYLHHERFSDENWRREVGEELYILGKQRLEEDPEPLALYIKDGPRGIIGEIEIDYDDDDEPPITPEILPKSDASDSVDKPDNPSNWRQELADVLIRVATEITQ